MHLDDFARSEQLGCKNTPNSTIGHLGTSPSLWTEALVCNAPQQMCIRFIHDLGCPDRALQRRKGVGMRVALEIGRYSQHTPFMLYAFDNQQLEKFHQRLAAGEPSDEQLMERIKGRDEQALAILYRRHLPLLRTVISRVLNNDWDVDDLMQEVFLEIWRQAEHYCEEKGKALGWIVTLARRRAIDRVRKKQAYSRAQERYRVELERDPEASACNDVDDEAATAEAHDIFKQVMSNLP